MTEKVRYLSCWILDENERPVSVRLDLQLLDVATQDLIGARLVWHKKEFHICRGILDTVPGGFVVVPRLKEFGFPDRLRVKGQCPKEAEIGAALREDDEAMRKSIAEIEARAKGKKRAAANKRIWANRHQAARRQAERPFWNPDNA